MSKDAELADLIRVQIEEPAAREIMDLVRQGVIQEVDRQLFNVSAEKYKRAVFAEYDAYDPVVRRELLVSLLADYQATIGRLLADVRGRTGNSGKRVASKRHPGLGDGGDSAVIVHKRGQVEEGDRPGDEEDPKPGKQEAAESTNVTGVDRSAAVEEPAVSRSWVRRLLRGRT